MKYIEYIVGVVFLVFLVFFGIKMNAWNCTETGMNAFVCLSGGK